jgi:tRNA modification GTPase
MEKTSTITALSTPQGTSALAVIRVSGKDTFSIIAKCIEEKEKFLKDLPRHLGIYKICSSTTPIDRVTIVKYCNPSSYTGEDMVEILCHGSMVIAEKIIETLISAGAVYAVAGEFTKRAFLNGKIDLVTAESIGQIISSKSTQAYINARKNYFGAYKPMLLHWKTDIEAILCEIETIIEFGEEDDIKVKNRQATITDRIRTVRKEIESELKNREIIESVEKGIKIAIVGAPNAGKSSLFNLIIGYERAIVHNEAGTTRDAVSESVKWQGMDIKFIDSAGIRNNPDPVEKMGVERSLSIIEEAEFVILVTEAGLTTVKEEQDIIEKRLPDKGIIGIINKVDLADGEEKKRLFEGKNIPYMLCSAVQPEQRDGVVDFITKKLTTLKAGIEHGSIVCTLRQKKILEKTSVLLIEAESIQENQEEIVAVWLREALDALEEFAGKSTSEELMNSIFSQFCIGK